MKSQVTSQEAKPKMRSERKINICQVSNLISERETIRKMA